MEQKWSRTSLLSRDDWFRCDCQRTALYLTTAKPYRKAFVELSPHSQLLLSLDDALHRRAARRKESFTIISRSVNGAIWTPANTRRSCMPSHCGPSAASMESGW